MWLTRLTSFGLMYRFTKSMALKTTPEGGNYQVTIPVVKWGHHVTSQWRKPMALFFIKAQPFIRLLEEGYWYSCSDLDNVIPDSKVHGANLGPIWGRQDPGAGPTKFAIWDVISWPALEVFGGHVWTICPITRPTLPWFVLHIRALPDAFWHSSVGLNPRA